MYFFARISLYYRTLVDITCNKSVYMLYCIINSQGN